MSSHPTTEYLDRDLFSTREAYAFVHTGSTFQKIFHIYYILVYTVQSFVAVTFPVVSPRQLGLLEGIGLQERERRTLKKEAEE